MKKLACVLVLCLVCFISGCGGKNAAAKQFGGSQTVNLPQFSRKIPILVFGKALLLLSKVNNAKKNLVPG